jgi:hypothetical protein
VRWPRDRAAAERGPNAKSGPAIPLPYTVASDTPLLVEVKAGGLQTIDLALKSK